MEDLKLAWSASLISHTISCEGLKIEKAEETLPGKIAQIGLTISCDTSINSQSCK